MSDRKDIKKIKGVTSSGKTGIQSTHKRTAVKGKVQDKGSLRKNLMVQFDKVQDSGSRKVQPVEVSSISGSSVVSVSQIIEETDRREIVREQEYGFQLPRSYIIAMVGLQEAVSQKEREVKQITVDLEKEKKMSVHLREQLQKLGNKNEDNQVKIIEYKSQVRLLQESSLQVQKQLVQAEQKQQKLKVQVAQQNEKKNEESKEINKIQTQLQKLSSENQQIMKQNKILRQDSKDIYLTREELKIEREARLRAQEEIEVLRKQASILAQRKVMAQQGQAREPLVDVTLGHSLRRDSSANKVPVVMIDKIDRKPQSVHKLSTHSQIIHSAKKPTPVKKLTEINSIRERSASGVKSRQNCPQLVSQYRQLMRYQKEMVALNFQLQLMEKGMVGQGQGAGLPQNYQKTRRECEQKQMQIRQLKAFLNDPLR